MRFSLNTLNGTQTQTEIVTETPTETETETETPTETATHSGSPSRKALQLLLVTTATKFGNATCASLFQLFLFYYIFL